LAAIAGTPKKTIAMSGMYKELHGELSPEELEKLRLNASLDKWSQPMKPGPDMGRQRTQGVADILKSRDRNKSSKGKHPSNYTPPKKKRK
jgi:hypothetical protein